MTTSKPLQIAGVIALLTSFGHLQMGLKELAPHLSGVAATTALAGWYQGCFGYAIFGLNYLRLAKTANFTPLDWATLVVQSSMHAFTIWGLTQTPPKALSVTLLLLVATGLATK